VTLGHDLGSTIEIVAGLKPEDSVITNPPDSLVSGETVRVVSGNPSGAGGESGAASE
jgi:hypothetical protein